MCTIHVDDLFADNLSNIFTLGYPKTEKKMEKTVSISVE